MYSIALTKKSQNQKLMKRISSLEVKDNEYQKADETCGNQLIEYGLAQQVPQGKWMLRYTTPYGKHDVEVEFNNKGEIVRTSP